MSQTRPSLEEAMHQYWERIYRLLFKLTGDPAQADDLALETFWRFWQKPPAETDKLEGWLYRVALHLGYNTLRASRRRQQHEQRAERWEAEENGFPLPESAAELAEERRRVRLVLQQLPKRQAQLLLLRHSGLSYREIAATLGIPATSVGKLLERAERTFERLYLRAERSVTNAPE